MKQYFIQICVPPKIRSTAVWTPAGGVAVARVDQHSVNSVRTYWETECGKFYEIPLLLREATDFIEMRKELHAMVDNVINQAEEYNLQRDKDVHPFAPHTD